MLEGIEFELGPERNTFTAIGRCPRTGRLGVSITTRELGVGGRCVHIRPNLGAVATQASTDPRLGPLALELLELGYPAQRVVSELEASDPFIEYRQLGIVDRWGHTAVRTGAENKDWAGHFDGDGWLVMGNNLRVDYNEEPMQELWSLFNALHPLVPYYKERPDNPTLGSVVDWAAARGLKI